MKKRVSKDDRCGLMVRYACSALLRMRIEAGEGAITKFVVVAGVSRSEKGIASLAYGPGHPRRSCGLAFCFLDRHMLRGPAVWFLLAIWLFDRLADRGSS